MTPLATHLKVRFFGLRVKRKCQMSNVKTNNHRLRRLHRLATIISDRKMRGRKIRPYIKSNKLPIIVFDLKAKDGMQRVVLGKAIGTLVMSE